LDASELASTSEPQRNPPPLGEALAIGGVLLAILVGAVGLSWFRSARRVEGSNSSYVGDSSCRACHPGESALHARSGHARTLRPAAETAAARRLDGVTAPDPERPGVTWSFAREGGKFTTTRREAAEARTMAVEWAFGSGRHAVTFGTLTDKDPAHPSLLEHRLTTFSHDDHPGLTPGQSLRGHAEGNTPYGRNHSPENTRACFGCHATTTSDRGPEFLDTSAMIPDVSCERCHGPGREHIEAARRGSGPAALAMPLGPGRSTLAEQVRACGQCHRLPEMVARGSIRTDNPVLVRHQPVGLMRSACFVKSGGALGCTTCHDPHDRSSDDTHAYEAACLKCHSGPAQTPCPTSPRSGCIACHMPRRDVARGMLMTDHWIRTRPDAAPGR
jgi:hypothetical protein